MFKIEHVGVTFSDLSYQCLYFFTEWCPFSRSPGNDKVKAVKNFSSKSDPTRLLSTFVASNYCDKTFARLVESLNGLVYSSALRRTGNSQLAEEIAQNVFAIMAKKAKALRRHPSLTAWALETTKYQSANAMRSEKRRRRKVEALIGQAATQDPASSNAMEDQCIWKDAVPFLDEALDRLPSQDRKVILQRFYEEKKFTEIAGESGQTVDACKKRSQRALQKLSALLRSRGVALSGTAVASLLGAEVARAAPAPISAAIASKALAASSTLSTSAVLTNTLQTMSTIKSNSVTAATLIALAAIPISQQLAERKSLQAELQTVREQPEAPIATARGNGRSRVQSRNATPTRWSPRTAGSLLDELASPPDPRTLAKLFMAVAASHVAEEDPWSLTMVLSRLNSMSEEEYAEFLNAQAEFPAPEHNKSVANLLMRFMHPGLMEPWQEILERVMATGKGGNRMAPMAFWAREDPDAALAWYREKVASGEILGKGLETQFEKDTFAYLVNTLAESQPDRALELFRERPQDLRSSGLADQVTGNLTKAMIKSGDDTHLRRMFEIHDRSRVLQIALKEYGSASKFGEGVAFVERFATDPKQRTDCIVEGILGLGGDTRQDIAMKWLHDNTPEAESREVFRRLEASGKISTKVLRQIQNQ